MLPGALSAGDRDGCDRGPRSRAAEALVNMSPMSVSQITLANAERASVKKPPWS